VDTASRLRKLGHDVVAIAWDPVDVLKGMPVVRPVTLGVLEGSPHDYGQRIRGAIRQGRRTTATEFLDGLSKAVHAARSVVARLDDELDFMLTPTLGDPPGPISQVATFGSAAWPRIAAFTVVASFAGLPAISIPAGLYNGLPVGVQLIGRPASDWPLLQLAEQLEKWEAHRFRPPHLPG
jgi:Asp-tRNA(Asn)/Glu-tRNA(Gln) amidotransferase A subunit family amidase